MLATLPRTSRYPVNVDNLGQLVWMEPRTREPWSMLLFAAAGKREDSNMNLGRSKGQLRGAVMAALERTGVSDRAGTLAAHLSYGHQRLLEVAMGLALKPRLLILDEPTQGLADSEIDNFIALVREIAKSATVLLIEHNMPVVMQLADRITVFNSGRILAEGTPEQIRANTEVQDAYLGATHG